LQDAFQLNLHRSHDCVESGCERITINVSGQRFETQQRTLSRFPDTLLGDPDRRRLYWDGQRNEVFLDRHRPTFQAVLYYYQSGGRLRKPLEVPEDVFLDELEFYDFGKQTIDDYKAKEGYIMSKVKALPEVEWQRNLWLFCEVPDSSRPAKVFAIFSVFCIMVSITNFCTETLPVFHREFCFNTTSDGGRTFQVRPNYSDPFFIIETMCVLWFSVEFVMRFVSSPSKRQFSRNLMNIFDVLAIFPYFVILAIQTTEGNCEAAKKSGSFVVIRVLRVFRIFKLSKHSQGLRILGMTIKTSMRELGMFFFFLIVAMVIFSSAAYYAEVGEKETQFTSIPDAFWWAIVTMTTVGYGDITPVGVWGKLVGTLCVIAGVLTIALPVPVVVANFNNFYRHESGHGYITA